MKVVCATRVGNMKDPNPETRGTVGIEPPMIMENLMPKPTSVMTIAV